MARINMELVVEEYEEQFSRLLSAVFDELVPENDLEPRQIMRVFRGRIEREFDRWEQVSGRCVDAE